MTCACCGKPIDPEAEEYYCDECIEKTLEYSSTYTSTNNKSKRIAIHNLSF